MGDAADGEMGVAAGEVFGIEVEVGERRCLLRGGIDPALVWKKHWTEWVAYVQKLGRKCLPAQK